MTVQKPNYLRGDFICTDCKRTFYSPHEGHFLDPDDEEAGRCVDCHLKNGLRMKYQLDQFPDD